MKSSILDWIYPPKCILCENIIELSADRWICINCNEVFKFVREPTCAKCGKPEMSENKICEDCKKMKFVFEKNYSLLNYDEISKHLIYKFKYGNHAEIGKALGLLAFNNTNLNIFKNIDLLTPVPIHKVRRKKRGYNQSEILCKEISKNIGLPMLKDLIIRIKNTKPQSKLTPLQRQKNLKDAFSFNKKYDITNKNILIVDDIYTTGRTLDECAKILLNNKCSLVYGFNLCIVVKTEEKNNKREINF